MLDVEQYYRILDLEPGASPEEVHQGYLDLTWVWHPDRFSSHPRLQKKAVYKFQELNEAHERLRSFQPIPPTRDLRTHSSSQASPSTNNKSSTRDVSKSDRNHPFQKDDQRTYKEYRRSVNFNAHDVDEWLD